MTRFVQCFRSKLLVLLLEVGNCCPYPFKHWVSCTQIPSYLLHLIKTLVKSVICKTVESNRGRETQGPNISKESLKLFRLSHSFPNGEREQSRSLTLPEIPHFF